MIRIAVTADCKARSKFHCNSQIAIYCRAEDTNCRLNPLLSVRLEVRKRRIKARY